MKNNELLKKYAGISISLPDTMDGNQKRKT